MPLRDADLRAMAGGSEQRGQSSGCADGVSACTDGLSASLEKIDATDLVSTIRWPTFSNLACIVASLASAF